MANPSKDGDAKLRGYRSEFASHASRAAEPSNARENAMLRSPSAGRPAGLITVLVALLAGVGIACSDTSGPLRGISPDTSDAALSWWRRVATVDVTPDTATLAPNGTLQAKAVAYDSRGTVLTGRTVAWASANADVAAVASTGLVTAKSLAQPRFRLRSTASRALHRSRCAPRQTRKHQRWPSPLRPRRAHTRPVRQP